MKYNKWKFSHEFLGAVFILAVLHVFLVRNTVAQDNIFNGYFVYAAIVSAIGIFAFIYSLIIRGGMTRNTYKIVELHKHDGFFEMVMASNKSIDYKSGQFVFVKFYNRKVPLEAHPFSIASKSGDDNLRIVVKKLGDYTVLLEHLNVGDKVSIEGPYGKFHYKNYDNHDQVWIAAGIGITPFIGMAEDLLDDNSHRVTLFYSVKDEADFVGYKLLENVAAKDPRFKFVPWNTSKQGHIGAKHIFEHSGKSACKEFFICGPPAFKDAIISGLLMDGVSKDKMHYEEFGFR
jgi:predicted ferric reductase